MRFTAVKLRRLERHLLQIEVAKRAVVACSRLSAIENGDVEARPDELQRIAEVLDVPTQELQREQRALGPAAGVSSMARSRWSLRVSKSDRMLARPDVDHGSAVAFLRPVAVRPIAS